MTRARKPAAGSPLAPGGGNGMIHFVRSGGSIPSDHLSYLVDYFAGRGINHVIHDRLGSVDEVGDGNAYVSCDMNVNLVLEPVRTRVYQVQLPHNLTGLKGSDFSRSQADLNILGGQRTARTYGVDPADPRFVVAGYAKWDTIYRERSLQKRRRQEIAAELDIDPKLPWVIFYPTGPNATYRGNAHRAPQILERLRRHLGELEYFLCDHARNRDDKEARESVRGVTELAVSDSHVHVVDGGSTLRFIAACDLFITDIASSLLTALSMDKPLIFLSIQEDSGAKRVLNLQRGPFLKDVPSIREFIASYRTPGPLRELLADCVAFDDDRNCERITDLILERYKAWRRKRTGLGSRPRG